MSQEPGAPPKADAHESNDPILVRSEALFGAKNSLHILHNGVIYRLQITQQGKLILTK